MERRGKIKENKISGCGDIWAKRNKMQTHVMIYSMIKALENH